MFQAVFLLIAFFQAPVELQVAGEESYDNLQRCDNFNCTFTAVKGRIDSQKIDDFQVADVKVYATSKGRWSKVGSQMFYLLGDCDCKIPPSKQPDGKAVRYGFIERGILQDGALTLDFVDGRVGQLFTREHPFSGDYVTPLNYGLLGGSMQLFPIYAIRNAGKFVDVVDVLTAPDFLRFSSKPKDPSGRAATLTYELSRENGMAPRVVNLASKDVKGIARVREFTQLNGAWFPKLVTYAQVDGASESAEVLVVTVSELQELTQATDFNILLKKGTILNDNIQEHKQITLDNRLNVGISDLGSLLSRVSVPDLSEPSEGNSFRGSVGFKVFLAFATVIFLFVFINALRKRAIK